MSQPSYLIVDQKQNAPETLPELLKELSAKYRLDIYQCRQRLVGRGLSLLAQGQPEILENISTLLRQSGYTHWLTRPSSPGFAPFRLNSIRITENAILLVGVEKELIISKEDRILAVFADLSGSLAEKSVQQLLSSHAYRGRDNVRHITEEKKFRTILQGQPILDLYKLDHNNRLESSVRVYPGKFDPKGLGNRATLSSRQNLVKVLEVVRDYAGELHLYTDFGLVNLPGCRLKTDDPDNPDTRRKNLISLVRYGWLMSDLLQAETRSPQAERASGDEIAATVSAAMATMNPALAAAQEGADNFAPLSREIDAEINAVGHANHETSNNSGKTAEVSEQGLPAPPPARSTSLWSRPGFWFGTGGSIAVMVLTILVDSSANEWLLRFAVEAFETGAAFFVAACLLFWYGFYFLRMKRQIENTPTSRVRSVAMGMVEVKGQAIRRYALLSPMSHTPCVYYRLTKYRREKNNQWKVSSVSSSDNVPFLLEDDTGGIEIDPSGCRVSARNKQEGSPGQIGLLSHHNLDDEKWIEETILEGTLIYVLGYASVKHDIGPNQTERKLEALRELKRNPDRMKQFDRDGDGSISSSEWDTARSEIEEQVLLDTLAEKSERKKQEEHIVIGKMKGHPLIISETPSEDHLTARYNYYSIPLILASALATGGAIYLLVNYLKG